MHNAVVFDWLDRLPAQCLLLGLPEPAKRSNMLIWQDVPESINKWKFKLKRVPFWLTRAIPEREHARLWLL